MFFLILTICERNENNNLLVNDFLVFGWDLKIKKKKNLSDIRKYSSETDISVR